MVIFLSTTLSVAWTWIKDVWHRSTPSRRAPFSSACSTNSNTSEWVQTLHVDLNMIVLNRPLLWLMSVMLGDCMLLVSACHQPFKPSSLNVWETRSCPIGRSSRYLCSASISRLFSPPHFLQSISAWDRHYSASTVECNLIRTRRRFAILQLKIIFRDSRSLGASRLSPTNFSGLSRVFQGVVPER